MKNVNPNHSRPIVCLDAGHYGKYNRSPAIPEYYESEMVWALHLYVKKELESYGIEVWQTRSNQAKDMGLVARGMASKGADLFISYHSNAVEDNVRDDIDYPVVYVPISGKGTELGKKIATAVEKTMGTKQKGYTSSRKGNNGDYYGVIRGATSVGTIGLIIEHSFHTNTNATRWLMDDNNLKKMAKIEAEIIAEYFDVSKNTSAEETPKEDVSSKKWYRIRKSWDNPDSQKGAYLSLDNAKKDCPVGYIVYDVDGNPVYANYPLNNFIKDIQKATGADVDGIYGPETISKTITVNRKVNNKSAVVAPIQRRLISLGYNPGEVDGSYGPATEGAVIEFQKDHTNDPDGEITARNITWRKLLTLK